MRRVHRGAPILLGIHRRRPTRCKLSDLDVLRIRQWAFDHPRDAIYQMARLLAPHYQVCAKTIEDVITRRSWRFLPEERVGRL